MGRKRFRRLQAVLEDGSVRVSFFSTGTDEQLVAGEIAGEYVIYRKRVDDFVWGRDSMEFFDGLIWGEDEIVCCDRLADVTRRKAEYIARDVEIGKTYAYGVSGPDESEVTGPVVVRVYDRRVWWPQVETDRRLDALAAKYSGRVTIKTYGHTVMGRPLRWLVAGNPEKTVAAVGTFHAGESGAELLVPVVEQLLEDDSELLDKVGLAIFPSTNIDTRERLIAGYPAYLRTNARGVDLNRNLPIEWEQVTAGYGINSDDPQSTTYRGSGPGSEPATQAVMGFLLDVHPAVVFSYHWMASLCGTGMLSPVEHVDEVYARRCRELADRFACGFHGRDDRDADMRSSDTPGSLELWVRETLHVPVFCVEWPDELLEVYQRRHVRALRGVMEMVVGG